jgi:hypothetical protein
MSHRPVVLLSARTSLRPAHATQILTLKLAPDALLLNKVGPEHVRTDAFNVFIA